MAEEINKEALLKAINKFDYEISHIVLHKNNIDIFSHSFHKINIHYRDDIPIDNFYIVGK